ncbi:MAG: hypothetical protein ACPGR2_17200 [Psychrobium sp.]
MTDHDIDQQYQQQATEMPPIDVDNKITQLAQQSVRKKPMSAFKRYAPLSLVASVALVSILVLNFPETYQQPPIEQAPAEPATIAAAPSEIAADDMTINEVHLSKSRSVIPPPMEQQQFYSDQSAQSARLSKRAAAKMQISADDKAIQIARIKDLLKQEDKESAIKAAKAFAKRYGKEALPKELHHLIAKPDK